MKSLTAIALVMLAAAVVWMAAGDPATEGGRAFGSGASEEPSLDVASRVFEGVAWIGDEPDDPREPGRGTRVVIAVDLTSPRSLAWGRRLVELADQLGDLKPIWLTEQSSREAAEDFLDDVGGRAPLLLGATRDTLERFRLFQAPSVRAFDAEGHEVARSLIPLAARARDAQ